METDKCRALSIAIEKGSITAAANRLGYTVSGVSKMILSLEDEFGFRLIYRSKKGIRPTEECLQLLPYLDRLLRDEEACAQINAQIKGIYQGKVRFGTSYDTMYGKIAGAIADFSAQYPNIQIEIIEATSSELYQMLESGKIDLCLASKREGNAEYTPIGQDEIVIWLPKGYKYLKDGKYQIDNLENESYIDIHPGKDTDNLRILKANDISVHSKYATSDVGAALSMVEAGLGVAMVNSLLTTRMSGDVITAHFNPPLYIEMGVATLKDIGPAAMCFKQYLLKILE